MNRLTVRIFIAAAIIALIHVGGYVVGHNAGPPKVLPAAHPLAELPMELDGWKGVDTGIIVRPDSDLATADVLNRDYQNGVGRLIHLHTAAFLEFEFGPSHPPQYCYAGAGYEILEQKITEFEIEEGTTIPVGHMVCEKDGRQVRLLYWYHLAKEVFVTREQQRDVFWSLLGQRAWPPQIKVLLHAPTIDAEVTDADLRDFAKQVYQFTKTL